MSTTSLAASALRSQVEGKRILVFGLGLQGGGEQTANALVELGAHVRVTDQKTPAELSSVLPNLHPQIEVSLGEHREEDIRWAELIMKNPAVPFEHPLLQLAEEKGIPITTETAMAISVVRDQVIGITGTRGKTTTTHLIHHILKEAGLPVVICGNIPHKPTLSQVLQAPDESLFVTEISSFHLEAMHRQQLSPKYAVITNIYPDHLNRYPSLESYAETKAALFRWQQPGDWAFWGTQHDWTKLLEQSVQDGVHGRAIEREDIVSAPEQYPSSLPGQHNIENIALAASVAEALNIPNERIAQGVASFTGVPYRLENIATIEGITFINDTTSTTPIALEKALQAVEPPFILLVGGATKKLPLRPELLALLKTQPTGIVWLKGSGTEELLQALGTPSVTRYETLESALQEAWSLAQQMKARAILFSPGFTSFEMFRNEFHRGDVFNAAVRTLQKPTAS